MLKSYDPEKACGLTHTVESTYMFDNGRLIGLYMVEISRTKEEMMQAHRDCVDALCRYQRDSMEEQLAALLKAATSEPSGINMED